MDAEAAAALIAPAVSRGGGSWADLGAGSGTFSAALVRLLGPGGCVYAVERDRRARAILTAASHSRDGALLVPIDADFTQPLPLPPLDGMLAANALHFVRDAEQAGVLVQLLGSLRSGGRFVLVEYDGRGPNRWVPFPISLARFGSLAAATGLANPTVVGTRPSSFGGIMYAAYADRVA